MLDLTIILISIVSFLFLLFLKNRNKPTGFPPPGPKGYPIIGNLLQLDHISLSELVKTYGDIYSLNIFGMKTIVLNSPDVVREALLREPNASIFASRRRSYFGKNFMFKYADIVFSSNTNTWAKRRKFSHRLLKAYGEGLKTIEKRLHHKLGGIIVDVGNYDNKAFDPENIITDFLIGIITGLIFCVLITLFIKEYFI
ncbi:hypothetical protein KUTeg_024325 [Tegillarca granosa]|uniref:Cytochrome P450 n=1 Tax=Tegillarca granosa TaxID=220873 RepID=A0ABQ9E132_TEGGR|nr:hypothetical protein KUTeg_024325 [Tegillarca granosa]